jgi:hypothetical protein
MQALPGGRAIRGQKKLYRDAAPMLLYDFGSAPKRTFADQRFEKRTRLNLIKK